MCSKCEKEIHISILVFTWTDHVRELLDVSPNVFSTSALLLEVQNLTCSLAAQSKDISQHL